MSYKSVTKDSYESTADAFAQNVHDLAPLESIGKFLKLLPPKGKILDIGCGPGRDTKIFTEKGFSVLGIDFSSKMIELAKEHAPLAEFQVADIESVNLPSASFDGVWACCSLLHIAKKDLPAVLRKIHAFLKPQGALYISLKEGSGEELKKDERYEGSCDKFWAYYTESEITQLVQEAHYNVLECSTVKPESTYQTHPGIRIFCKKC